ncbi:MAG: DinB family protein [Vicinamibacterales bacterium]
MSNELPAFLTQWERETQGTVALLEALRAVEYDFRPDAGGRSVGELAWHLAEVDAYVSLGIVQGGFDFPVKPPHLDRPRALAAFVEAFTVVHREAVARVEGLQPSDLDREIRYADGTMWTIRDLLWRKLLLHAVGAQSRWVPVG